MISYNNKLNNNTKVYQIGYIKPYINSQRRIELKANNHLDDRDNCLHNVIQVGAVKKNINSTNQCIQVGEELNIFQKQYEKQEPFFIENKMFNDSNIIEDVQQHSFFTFYLRPLFSNNNTGLVFRLMTNKEKFLTVGILILLILNVIIIFLSFLLSIKTMSNLFSE